MHHFCGIASKCKFEALLYIGYFYPDLPDDVLLSFIDKLELTEEEQLHSIVRLGKASILKTWCAQRSPEESDTIDSYGRNCAALSFSTTSVWPASSAMVSALSPFLLVIPASAPAFTRASTTST